MTRSVRASLVLVSVLVTVIGSAYGQQPPDVVQSDVSFNTAMGSQALLNLTSGGVRNTASGDQALYSNTTGGFNTANGNRALFANTTGYYNTASGNGALSSNTSGYWNTASGVGALSSNTTASVNTAFGYAALFSNTTGSYNTASGAYALEFNTTGTNNSAVGYHALYTSISGNDNTAFGYNALYSNTSGSLNNAAGYSTLYSNTTGKYNNGMGTSSLYSNTTGNSNSAVGYGALYNNTTGSTNVAIGYISGYSLTTGSNNIDISNPGVAGESGVIRIGTPGTHVSAIIAGISGVNVTGGVNVMVNSNGQLGVMSSSRRYKEDIQPVADASERLLKLRPVTFRYKQPDETGQKPLQYGLIAEEVAATFPELVVYNDKGQPETVRYQELTPILLNEVQQLHEQLAVQASKLDEVSELKQQFAELQAVNRAMQAALMRLQPNDSQVTMRSTQGQPSSFLVRASTRTGEWCGGLSRRRDTSRGSP
jgi:hypothetical protein